ncbi:MAG TPA: hypothetical protein VI462_06100 [Acidimicrobiia bacterium]
MADALEIDVPLDLRSLRTVRLAALDAAARAGLDVPSAHALQAGMDELCVAVVEAATGTGGAGRLVVRLRFRAGEVSARGVARLDHDRPPVLLGPLARSILAASVDDFTIVDEADLVCFEVWKRSNGDGA